MVNKPRRINNLHEDLEVKLLQIKFEEVFLRERLKKNEKEFDKVAEQLIKLVERENKHG